MAIQAQVDLRLKEIRGDRDNVSVAGYDTGTKQSIYPPAICLMVLTWSTTIISLTLVLSGELVQKIHRKNGEL